MTQEYPAGSTANSTDDQLRALASCDALPSKPLPGGATEQPPHAIEIVHLSKTFEFGQRDGFGTRVAETTEALRDVSFSVTRNEFISIVGPSGCGKTTFLRLIAGLTFPKSGEVRIGGQPVIGPNPRVAMVFQSIGLLPWRTVAGNIEVGLRWKQHRPLTAAERELVKHYIDLVGLHSFEHYYPAQLSGGMQQRVGLARALAREPEILLMDEPFGALDAQTRMILQDELLRIYDQYKTTVVFVTHDLEEAIYLSDRVVILTRRPGTVKCTLSVGLRKPRYGSDVRSEAEFIELKRYAWSSLREELDTLRETNSDRGGAHG